MTMTHQNKDNINYQFAYFDFTTLKFDLHHNQSGANKEYFGSILLRLHKHAQWILENRTQIKCWFNGVLDVRINAYIPNSNEQVFVKIESEVRNL
jgi:hypothetical protein